MRDVECDIVRAGASNDAFGFSIGAIFESDLSLALWVQLGASAAFRDRLLGHVVGPGPFRLVALAKNVREPSFGETDLLLIVEGVGGHRIAVLAEIKLTAAFQARQAERYTERGERGRRAGEWDEYWTVLVAPECYIRDSNASDWGRTLSIETATGWLADDTSTHTIFLSRLLLHATSKDILGREENPAAMEFWRLYVEYATEHFPELEVELVPSGRSKRKAPSWARFGSRALRNQAVRISHKGNASCIDLIVRNCPSGRLKAAVGLLLEDEMSVKQAGSSAVVRVNAPRIWPQDAFDSQLDNIKAIFKAGERILRFCKLHRSTLEDLVR
ncbi:hypothetical protein B0G80_4399 [Paraburkholderia sp. BL6669N2]|uniref:hypothetical protein n=1 Tax=Paraburkholderia sp. BL6669N2 TaxID=1938807 RepID=UPI000E25ABDF|nr:hypothetical protein [Paraburkholderia sp. BL6669N2]REG61546.1 hypothetical protein B0G80_4399 [Paraburkholderia sp. BL6669N2]